MTAKEYVAKVTETWLFAYDQNPLSGQTTELNNSFIKSAEGCRTHLGVARHPTSGPRLSKAKQRLSVPLASPDST